MSIATCGKLTHRRTCSADANLHIPTAREVRLVSLDSTVGHETKKTRPAVVVINNVYNEHNWLVLVMPLTSRDIAAYDQVSILPPEGGISNSSVTLPDQVRAVDRKRLVRRLGSVTPHTMQQIDRSLRTVLDL